jgi:hypothetical protein
MAKNKGGRPTVMTEDTLQKLEMAFAIGASDIEACVYADIVPSTLYNYQNDNPEFLERKRMLKDRPLLKARQTVVDNLNDPRHAEWYLERKLKNEFSQRTESVTAEVTIDDIIKEFDQDPDDKGEGYE